MKKYVIAAKAGVYDAQSGASDSTARASLHSLTHFGKVLPERATIEEENDDSFFSCDHVSVHPARC